MWTLMGKFQYFSVSFDRGRNVNANPLQSECNARKADWNVKTQQHASLLQLFALFSLWSWGFQLRCRKYVFDFDIMAKLEMVKNLYVFSNEKFFWHVIFCYYITGYPNGKYFFLPFQVLPCNRWIASLIVHYCILMG